MFAIAKKIEIIMHLIAIFTYIERTCNCDLYIMGEKCPMSVWEATLNES